MNVELRAEYARLRVWRVVAEKSRAALGRAHDDARPEEGGELKGKG